MNIKDKRIAILAPVAWRTPPRHYGAWETVAGNIAEGLVARGFKNITLFATKDSITKSHLVGWVEKGYEEDKSQNPLVSTMYHIQKAMEMSGRFDLIHNNFDYLPLTFAHLIKPPMLTTIHGFGEPDIKRVYRDHKETYFVSISDSDRDSQLPYIATVYNGIDISNITFRQTPGKNLIFCGRIHPDKGLHLAIQVAQKTGIPLIVAGIIQYHEYFGNCAKNFDGRLIKYIGPVNPKQRNDLFADALCLLHLNTIPERFGLVLAESNAAGVPVIAADSGSCREVIADKKTGFLVRSVEDAIEAIGKINRIDRRQCRRRVKENFTIEKMACAYEKVYEKIFKHQAEKQTLFNFENRVEFAERI